MIRGPLALLWLEIRRNEFRWLFLVVTVGVGLALSGRLDGPIVFWETVSLAWRDALFVLGPWTGATAAWTAGRERRHGLDELLATTPRPPFRRQIWGWAAVTTMALLSYLLIGGWLVLASVDRVSGSGPAWRVIVVGAMSLAAFSAAGFAWGAWVARRATAFLAMIAFSLLQLILADGAGAGSFLSAVPSVQASPWLGITPDLTAEQAWLFVGMTGLSLALLARSTTRGWTVRGAIGGSALIMALAAVAIIAEDDAIRGTAASFAGAEEPGAPAVGSYKPVCRDGDPNVCVAPAFAPLLDEAASAFSRLRAATSALPGWPARIDLLPVPAAESERGVVSLPLRAASVNDDLRRATHEIARALVNPGGEPGLAVNTLLVWALTEAGRPVRCAGEQATDTGAAIAPVNCAAVARLTALDPAVMGAWLSAHAAVIAEGTLTLEDLP